MNSRNIARVIARTLKKFPKVNLLPYHKFGMGKYQMLDRKYHLEDFITQTSAEQFRKINKFLNLWDLSVKSRGKPD